MKSFARLVLLTILLGLVISCSKEEEKITVSFTDAVIADSVILANPDGKAVVKLTYQKIAPSKSVKAGEINSTIDDYVASLMVNYSEDSLNQANINYLLDEFLISYEEFHNEFPEAPQEWEINSVGKIRIYGNYISQRFDSYYNTGGAHPNSATTFLNFNFLTGKEIDLINLIKENKFGELSSLCEKKFREARELSPQESLTEAGFWFEDDKFFLTDNFGFTSNSLIFYYNPYEIAPYVMGPTEIEVNFNEITSLLK